MNAVQGLDGFVQLGVIGVMVWAVRTFLTHIRAISTDATEAQRNVADKFIGAQQSGAERFSVLARECHDRQRDAQADYQANLRLLLDSLSSQHTEVINALREHDGAISKEIADLAKSLHSNGANLKGESR